MLGKLFLLFTGATLIELGLLIYLGEILGLWPTLALIVITGMVGATMARNQGLLVLRRIQTGLESGNIPTSAMMDGLFVLVAGAFLVTPGVLTDALGFTLLIPPARKPFKRWLQKRFTRWIEEGKVGVNVARGPFEPKNARWGEIVDVRDVEKDSDEEESS